MPENFYNYPMAIVHRDFTKNGGDLSKISDRNRAVYPGRVRVGQKCILKRTGQPYWGKDIDDPYMFGPIYLDEIHYFDHGEASTAQLAAFASGQVDVIYEFDIASYAMAQSVPNSTIYEAQTAQTGVLRMKVTKPPFTDVRVRRAVQLCCDAPVYPELVYQGRATAGDHHHVAPIHPEYFALPPMKPNIEQAKKLLAEAGFPRRPRAQHRLRQHQRPLAAAGLRDPAGAAGPGRDQAQHQHHADDPILGHLDDVAVRHHRLDASSARHDGPLGRLPQRRALERERLCKQGVRQPPG